MIEAVGLTKRFAGRTAVDDVSFRVEPGEVVGFLGPNGAGKTTTMRLLLGLLRPDAGRAVRPPHVGFVPEQAAAYDQLAVRAHLRFLCRVKGVATEEADRAIEHLSLGELAGRPISRLSRGQRQRVALAAGVLGSPPAYVLDEPTTGLDPRQVVPVRHLVRSLAAGGAAVLLSTHLLAEAAVVCDRVLVIAGGRLRGATVPTDVPDLEAWFLDLVTDDSAGIA